MYFFEVRYLFSIVSGYDNKCKAITVKNKKK